MNVCPGFVDGLVMGCGGEIELRNSPMVCALSSEMNGSAIY